MIPKQRTDLISGRGAFLSGLKLLDNQWWTDKLSDLAGRPDILALSTAHDALTTIIEEDKK